MLSAVLLLLASSVAGQEDQLRLPSDPELRESFISRVQEKLSSTEPETSAWGAYQTGRYGLHQYIPQLLELVERENSQPPDRSPLVKKAALDALVLLEAPVSPELLSARMEPKYYPEILILASRRKKENAGTMLRLMDLCPKDSPDWWAAAAILSSERPATYAKRLLNGFQIQLTVKVSDSGTPRERGMRTGPGMVRARFSSENDGFPPWSGYYFSMSKHENLVSIQEEPIEVYYWRRETKRQPLPRAESFYSYDRRKIVFRCIKELLDKPIVGLSPQDSVAINCLEANCLEKFDAKLNNIRTAYRVLLEELIKQGLLDRDDASSLNPDIQVVVKDRRKNKRTSLSTFRASFRDHIVEHWAGLVNLVDLAAE